MKRLLKSTLTLLALAATVFTQEVPPAGPQLTAYGMAQYRLRLQLYSQTPDAGDAVSAMDYMNQIGYMAGLKVKVNEAVLMQFQAGNDFVSTEAVSWVSNNWGSVGHSRTGSYYPYFHLAFAKWTASMLSLTAGIQPVASNGPLDLIERSMITGNYKNAALVTWIVGTNATMGGLKLGVPILKDGFKLGAELFTSVTEKRSQTLAVEPTSNPSAAFMLLDLPMSVAALTVTPQIVAIINRNYNSFSETGDHEIGYGLAGSYKIKDGFSATFCLGMASNGNAESGPNSIPDTADHIDGMRDAALYENAGMVGGVGASYKVGPGAAIVDFKYGTDENKEVADSKSSYIYADVKYGWDANKNFQIMPRVRVFVKQFEETNANVDNTEIRPELIFTGKF